jgi:hypothetical protein
MPSERKLAANRGNARRSTGPRTTAGKSRASRNALRHGLAAMSVPAALPPLPEIERVARAICGPGASPWQYQQAVIIAEAEHIHGAHRPRRCHQENSATLAAAEAR